LPGSGKTTIARELEPEFRKLGWPVEVLDADEIRQNLSKGPSFGKEDREPHLKRAKYVARMLWRKGVAVVSPYRSMREYARKESTNFVEVFVKCRVEICAKRDPKGLHRKASAGHIKDLTGPQDLHKEPLQPDLVVDAEKPTLEETVGSILAKLHQLGFARP